MRARRKPRADTEARGRERTAGSLLLCLGIPPALGAAAALLTAEGMRAYGEMAKPPLAPPGWVFPLAWTALYLIMGWASWRILGAKAPGERREAALSLYAVQLAVNFLWPLVFFGMGRYWLAFFLLLLLLALAFLTWKQFRRIDRTAGLALAPYLLWLCFAAYLNFAAGILN